MNTIKKMGLIGLMVGSLVGAYFGGVTIERNKHKDDSVSITVDHYGEEGLRVNVYGTLGEDKFGLMDITQYSKIRDRIYRSIPDSLDNEKTFSRLDSLMNKVVKREIGRSPYDRTKWNTQCWTSDEFHMTISKAAKSRESMSMEDRIKQIFNPSGPLYMSK